MRNLIRLLPLIVVLYLSRSELHLQSAVELDFSTVHNLHPPHLAL
ncbi:hypothetical protein VDG1235_2345 [Verrucomicrobiia bacterium DG1235]|nr:hypothetical protein VDG1235_2345 [Verrucomicrobiae bacterium DG1235]